MPTDSDIGHLILDRTDSPTLPLRQAIYIGNPSPIALIVTRITLGECDVTIHDDAGTRRVTLRKLEDLEIAPGISIRMNGMRESRWRWVDLRISASKCIPIWRAELYANHYQQITAARAA